jgi:hypothetical protein
LAFAIARMLARSTTGGRATVAPNVPVQTKPILVHCVNCVAAASDNTGTIVAGIGVAVAVIGVIVAIAAYKVATKSQDIAQDSLRAAQASLTAAQDTLNIAREEHTRSVVEYQEFLRRLTAPADFALTAELLPDGGDTFILSDSSTPSPGTIRLVAPLIMDRGVYSRPTG